MSRERALRLVLLLLAAAAASFVLNGCAAPAPREPAAPSSPSAPTTPSVPATTAVAEGQWPASIGGFAKPTSIVAPDDGSHRLFVTEQAGTIRVIKNGALVRGDALDIRTKVGSSGNEQGLLDIAFPPGFASKGYAYVDFTDRNGDTRIYRVHVSAQDPDAFDVGTMQLILTVRQPYSNHNGGQLAFGPDGYLYVGMGDGGSAGDPGNRGQDTTTLLGKILRIDTESTPDTPGYSIPAGNPFEKSTRARPEIWLVGLRNPWRFSFDSRTGDLWIGDVGQDAWEEIDLLPPGSGGANLGWSLYEGTHLMNATKKHSGFVWPVAEYSHREGESVTGGYVYRGRAYPGMDGTYVFADFVVGKIWTLTPGKTAGSWTRRLAIDTPYQISTFGVDGTGELWFADWGKGVIHRLGDLSK